MQTSIQPLRSVAPLPRATRKLAVLNRNGLHARPSAELVRCVRSTRSEVWFVTETERIRADRIMEILLANLTYGAQFTVEAEGADATEAINKIERVLDLLKNAEYEIAKLTYPDRDFSE